MKIRPRIFSYSANKQGDTHKRGSKHYSRQTVASVTSRSAGNSRFALSRTVIHRKKKNNDDVATYLHSRFCNAVQAKSVEFC